MPRIKLTKSAIDTLPVPNVDLVYWDIGLPGFGVKVTPKGRKVFIVMYRSAGGRLRKYMIGPYGRVTLHQAKLAAQKIFTAKMEGRDPAAEKREARRKVVEDRVDDLLEAFIAQHVGQTRSAREVSRMLRREISPWWGAKSIHEITKRDVVGSRFRYPSARDPDRRKQSLKDDQDLPSLVCGTGGTGSIAGRRGAIAGKGGHQGSGTDR